MDIQTLNSTYAASSTNDAAEEWVLPEGLWFLMNPTETSHHQGLQPNVLPHQVDKAPHIHGSTNTRHRLALY